MDFEFTKEEIAMINEIRAFIKQESTPDLLVETRELEGIYGGPLGRKFVKKFAANGWLASPPAAPRERARRRRQWLAPAADLLQRTCFPPPMAGSTSLCEASCGSCCAPWRSP